MLFSRNGGTGEGGGGGKLAPPQILEDQLTLFEPRAQIMPTPPPTPIFSDLPPALLRLLKQGNLVESRRYVPLLLKLSNMYRVMKK